MSQTNSTRPKIGIVGSPPPCDEKLRLWLENYIKSFPQFNTDVLSRSDHIGISRTALDSYLAGNYFLSKEAGGQGVKSSRIETMIRAYRDKVEGTVRHGYKKNFIETRAWQQFQHGCATAINENAIVVIYGPPGVGKSRCLREFKLRKMSTLPIHVECSANITTRYFVQKIAAELGLDESVTTARLEDLIAEKLRRNPRPLFVDQANYLNEKGLGAICYIWEAAQIPIVLTGTTALYDLFTNSRMTEDVRMQLSSRIAMHYPLVTLGTAEIKSLIRRVLGDSSNDLTIAQILNVTGGIYRSVDMILPRILELQGLNEDRLAKGETTLTDIIDTAGRRLMAG